MLVTCLMELLLQRRLPHVGSPGYQDLTGCQGAPEVGEG